MSMTESAGSKPRRTMQHAMSNPLTALMAEIQLLQMDDTASPAVQASCTRMVELVRRLNALARQLGDTPEQP